MFSGVNGAENKQERKFFVYLGIVFLAFVTIAICSKSSFLYPINDWADANIYFDITKGMLHGKVPYRDLYDQKGPFIYFLYALGVAIDEKSYFGVFLIEVIAAAAFLLFLYKTVTLYCRKSLSILILPLAAMAVYTSTSFCHGGSAEELILPMYMFMVYKLFAFSGSKQISKIDAAVIGVLTGIIFWIKFTLIALPGLFGLYIVFVYLRDKKIKELFDTIWSFLAGIVVPTAMVLAFYAMKNSLIFLWEGYFANNLFSYNDYDDGSTMLNYFWWYKKHIMENNTIVFVLFCIGLVFLAVKRKYELLVLDIAVYGFIFVSLYVGGKCYTYYPLVASVCCLFGCAAIVKVIELLTDKYDLKSGKITAAFAILSIVSFVGSYALTSNKYLMFQKKSDTVQFQFADTINKIDKDDQSLFVYHTMDRGYYLAVNQVPSMKYFCKTNLALPEMREEQEKMIKERKTNFVVNSSIVIDEEQQELMNFIEECGYTEVDRRVAYHEKADRIYILYTRKENVE